MFTPSKFTNPSRPFAIYSLKFLLLLGCSVVLARTFAAAQSSSDTVGAVLYASQASVKVGNWNLVADSTAAGGARLANPDDGGPKALFPLAEPTDYFELTFDAEAGRPYHLWIRGKAEGNSH